MDAPTPTPWLSGTKRTGFFSVIFVRNYTIRL